MKTQLSGLRISWTTDERGNKRNDSGLNRGHGAAGDRDDLDHQHPRPSVGKKNLLTLISGKSWTSEQSRLTYLSIPIDFLFCGSEGILEEVYDGYVSKGGIAMSCARWKDELFLIGGMKDTQRQIREGNFRKKVRSFQIKDSELMPSSYSARSPMHSRKVEPIVFVHNDKIYVLSQSAKFEADYFECYHPSQDRWDILKPPPFYNPKCRFYDSSPISFSYVLLDDRICVSNGSVAYAYNIKRDVWEICTLFGNFRSDDPLRPFGRQFDMFGTAFHFEGEAIVVEDWEKKYLIATTLSSDVFAYEVSAGMVIRRQALLILTPDLEGDNVALLSFAALGGHYYCMEFEEYYDGVTSLILMTFQASPKRDSQYLKEFFDVKVCNKCKIKTRKEDRDWHHVQTLAV